MNFIEATAPDTAKAIAKLETAGHPWTAALATVLASLVIACMIPAALAVLAWRKLKQ